MTRPPDALEIALRLIPLLDELGIESMVMGGLAVVTWGVPRATLDVDFALLAGGDEVERLLHRVEREGHVVEDHFKKGWRDRLRDMEVVKFQFKEGVSLTRVDLFPIVTEFQRSAFSRRVQTRLDRLEAWLVSAADLILFKLLAFRDKDRADLSNLFTVQGVPERAYLESWVDRLGLRARYEEYRPD